MREIHILPSGQDVADAVAAFVASLAEQRARANGRFAVALSGGSTPRALYRVLASPPYAGRIAWDLWEVFWSDERCVPPDHPDSNYLMSKETLLDQVGIPGDRIHRVQGELVPKVAAAQYEQALRCAFPTKLPVFDLILLGLGDDGHTASLFPGTDALAEQTRLVVANWVPHLGTYRITFTFPLINAARAVAFLVTDASKAEALRAVLVPHREKPRPAGLVRPASGTVHWFLNRCAAAQIEGLTR